ncbi:MAG: insulinase family protein [Culturomica sp.]|jgi:predicted Zn-dependent peptidase|nr:insulinase family protein [Culturomica sp.]
MKKAPALSEPVLPKLLPHTEELLPNGTELVVVNDPNQEVFKLDILYESGSYYQPQPLVASAAINMLAEGTTRHSAAEIAEWFDYYGAYTDHHSGFRQAELNLFSLTKYAAETIDRVAEMATESTVPPAELEVYLRSRRQQFLTEKQKTAWMARKESNRLLFGEHHPYANQVCEADYGRVTPELVRDFYRERILSGRCCLILSGCITSEIKERVVRTFGETLRPPYTRETPVHAYAPAAPGRYNIEKPDAVQTSIRISKHGVRLPEKEYAGFLLLNTIFGGYFGSRLMSNIREEKGYTYGIQSYNVSMPDNAYWCIVTDVDNAYTEATLEEIRKELDSIRREPVGREELELVKKYLHGELLREIDGVFAQTDALKQKRIYGMDNDFYATLLAGLKKTTPEELLELAQNYWDPEEMYVVTVGKTRP